MADFTEILSAAPPIRVFAPRSKNNGGGVTFLTPKLSDERRKYHRYSQGEEGGRFIQGDGSHENPYTYKHGAPVSSHYVIVDLWFGFRDRAVFISVNHWILKVSPEGVTAEDGHFTKLS